MLLDDSRIEGALRYAAAAALKTPLLTGSNFGVLTATLREVRASKNYQHVLDTQTLANVR